MNILFLVDRKYYTRKMSRIRFHTIRGIADYLKDNGLGELHISGPGFDDWDPEFNCDVNVNMLYKGKEKPAMVIGFKPLELPNFAGIDYPKCVRYNEMYDFNWTAEELMKSQANLVICHHHNDFSDWSKRIPKGTVLPWDFKFAWVPHSIDTHIFTPSEIEPELDVVILGATHVNTLLGSHYPLRERMVGVLAKMPEKYRCQVVPHVGGDHSDSHTDKYMYDFAQQINNAKILVTCSGAPKSRFGKYLEASACGTAVAGDVYNDHPDDVVELKKFLIEINMSMTDEQIIDTLVEYLEDNEKRQVKIDAGLEYMTNFGLKQYAERFVKAVEDYQVCYGNVTKHNVQK